MSTLSRRQFLHTAPDRRLKLGLIGGGWYGQIIGNAAANALLKWEYRQPWQHPHRG